MAESAQHKLYSSRPPRVRITHDVELGKAIEKKEDRDNAELLPDLSGQPAQKFRRGKIGVVTNF
jgi:predicted component of type VI protein secretion system